MLISSCTVNSQLSCTFVFAYANSKLSHNMAYMSRVVRKPAFCICKNKDADQLRGNREADQRLCFRYIESTIPLLLKYEISCLLPSSVAVQPHLSGTWSKTPEDRFSHDEAHMTFVTRKLVLRVSNQVWLILVSKPYRLARILKLRI